MLIQGQGQGKYSVQKRLEENGDLEEAEEYFRNAVFSKMVAEVIQVICIIIV